MKEQAFNAAEVGLSLARTLEARQVPYALGGALAYGVWALPRATKDVDLNLFAATEQLPGALDALASAGVAFEREAALAAPQEDGPRAVYSDRLTEQGDPRGEFIALQLSRARATPGTPARDDLAARAQALEKQHAARWSKAVAQFTLKQWYRRGFIAIVDMRVQAFVANGARLFELAPIEKVILRGLDSGALRKLAASPTLEKVDTLGLVGDLRAADTQTLGKSPHLGRLRTLDFQHCDLIGRDRPSLAPLLAACPKLEWLEVDALSDSIATALLGFPNVRVRATSKKFASAAARQLVAANRVVSA